jgi:hypothetical protein
LNPTYLQHHFRKDSNLEAFPLGRCFSYSSILSSFEPSFTSVAHISYDIQCQWDDQKFFTELFDVCNKLNRYGFGKGPSWVEEEL